MIKKIMKMGGCKTEAEFYKKYPTEEAFLEAFPQARPMLEQRQIGGTMIVPKAQIGRFNPAPAERSTTSVAVRNPEMERQAANATAERQRVDRMGRIYETPNPNVTSFGKAMGLPSDQAAIVGQRQAMMVPAAVGTGAIGAYGVAPVLGSTIGSPLNPINWDTEKFTLSEKQKGGVAFPQAPTADRFFNYGAPTPNVPRFMQAGGENTDNSQMAFMQIVQAVSQHHNIKPEELLTSMQNNLEEEQLGQLTMAANSDPDAVLEAVNAYTQNTFGEQTQELQSQYLEGQPFMQQMLDQQAQSEDQYQMPMNPNQAMQMAYGGSNLRKFTKKYQKAGQPQTPAPPPEEDSFWDSGWGALTRGVGITSSTVAATAALSKLINSKTIQDLMTKTGKFTAEQWAKLPSKQKLWEMTKATGKKGAKFSKTGTGISTMIGLGLWGITEALDLFEEEPKALPQQKQKAPSVPSAGVPNSTGVAPDSTGLPADSSDGTRAPAYERYGGTPYMYKRGGEKKKSNVKNLKKGGVSAPMGTNSNDQVKTGRLDAFKKYIDGNVYNSMLKQEQQDILKAFSDPQYFMKQMQPEQEQVMAVGGSASGFINAVNPFDRRRAPVGQIDGMNDPSGKYSLPSDIPEGMTEEDEKRYKEEYTFGYDKEGNRVSVNKNKADDFEWGEAPQGCPPGYKYDPQKGDCVVEKTRAGMAMENIGEAWQGLSGAERANMVLGMSGAAVSGKEQINRQKYDEQLERNLFNNYTFAAKPSDRGYHMTNQLEMVPPTMQTPVQFTGKNYRQDFGYSKQGGEMYLTDDQIKHIISLGGQVEFLD